MTTKWAKWAKWAKLTKLKEREKVEKGAREYYWQRISLKPLPNSSGQQFPDQTPLAQDWLHVDAQLRTLLQFFWAHSPYDPWDGFDCIAIHSLLCVYVVMMMSRRKIHIKGKIQTPIVDTILLIRLWYPFGTLPKFPRKMFFHLLL